MRVDDTLAAIDAVPGCQQCGGQMGDSPSTDFCSEGCQERWHRGVDESEVRRRGVVYALAEEMRARRVVPPQIQVDLSAVREQFAAMTEAVRVLGAEMVRAFAPLARAARPYLSDEESPQQRALRLQRTRNTGPSREQYPRRGRR